LGRAGYRLDGLHRLHDRGHWDWRLNLHLHVMRVGYWRIHGDDDASVLRPRYRGYGIIFALLHSHRTFSRHRTKVVSPASCPLVEIQDCWRAGLDFLRKGHTLHDIGPALSSKPHLTPSHPHGQISAQVGKPKALWSSITFTTWSRIPPKLQILALQTHSRKEAGSCSMTATWTGIITCE
jgi:hypothetical protein